MSGIFFIGAAGKSAQCEGNLDIFQGADVLGNLTVEPGNYGSKITIREISEEVTIAVGAGAAGQATATNLIPAGSIILGVSYRVTQAPGADATTLDVGRTNGGNLDEFVAGASCDVLGETASWPADGDGNLVFPVCAKTADTITLTTNANVATSAMKVRVCVQYATITAPQA